MATKGDQTKQWICHKTYELFVNKGFKSVTMKDVCEATELSRGGLYRHFSSTEDIFMTIIDAMHDHQSLVYEKIAKALPAVQILDELFTIYQEEMLDSKHCLSLAIFEYFSDESPQKEERIRQQYQASKDMWVTLIQYGIDTKEFREVNPEAIFDVILFSYQGVRLYSRMMHIDDNIPQHIFNQIRKLIL